MPTGAPTRPARDAVRRAAPVVLGSLFLLLALAPPETRGEGAIAVAFVAAVAVAAAAAVPGGPPRFAAVPVLAVAGAAATLASSAPGPAVVQAALVVAAVALGCVAAGSHGLAGSSAFAGCVALGGAAAAIHGLWQAGFGLGRTMASLDPAWLEVRGGEFAARLDAGRAFAAFPTPAALGGWLALTLPVTVGLARGATGWARRGAIAAAIVQGAGLAATRSVTAAVALAGAAAIVALGPGRRAGRRALVALVAVGLLAGAIALGLRRGEVIEAAGEPTPLDLRLGNVRTAAAMAVAHPWRGVGLGAFGDVYPSFRAAGDNETRYAHSLPMQALAELGVPLGSVAGLAFLVLFLAPALRRGSFDDPVRAGIAVGLASFALHNLADFTAWLPSFALAAAVLRGALAAPHGPSDGEAVAVPSGAGTRVAAAACALAAFAVLALDGAAHDARWRAWVAAVEGDRGTAAVEAGRAAALAPWSPEAHAALAAAARTLEPPDLARALAAADRAVAVGPYRPALRVLRAGLREAVGDVPGAWADADRAAALHPASATEAALRARLEDRVRAWSARRP